MEYCKGIEIVNSSLNSTMKNIVREVMNTFLMGNFVVVKVKSSKKNFKNKIPIDF